jgi:RNA-directed DNA polymerase
MDDHIRTTTLARSLVGTREDLAALLGTSVDLIVKIVSDPLRFYSQFSVPKSNGELRTIRPPCRQLKSVQRSLLNLIYRRVHLRSCLHGGIRGKSIITHARAHVGRVMVATLDIRKFFPSTSPSHLLPVFEVLGFVDQAATDLLHLVTLDGGLPQGAPSSSILANLAFAAGDSRYIRICGRQRLRYSRYVDDIAVSGDHEFGDLRGPFVDAIKYAGYTVAPEKVHFTPRSARQVVTGLVVNDRLRPTPEFIAELKHEIRLCQECGAATLAVADGISVMTLKNRLTGRVGHVKQADRSLGKRLQGLLCGVDWRSAKAVTA